MSNIKAYLHVRTAKNPVYSPDGEWIAWASNRRHPAYFDLYIQNIYSLEIRNIFTGEGNYNVLKWHPDGNKLLIEKSFSGLDNILGILDLETGKTDWITEREGEAKYAAPQFSEMEAASMC